MKADPHFKLLLAVVLTALYERDPSLFIPTTGYEKRWRSEVAVRNARNAEQFVASDTFDMYCNMLKMKPEFMRNLSPEKAANALNAMRMDQGKQSVRRHTEVIVEGTESSDMGS